MKRINKYRYLFVVQGNYSGYWEDVTESDNWKEARQDLRDYNDNERMYPHRLIQRRVLNPKYVKES